MKQTFADFGGIREFELKPVVVEEKVHLSVEEYKRFLSRPLKEYDFKKKNADMMWIDRKRTYHCLLVTGEGHTGGVLVQTEGAGYAVSSAYVPDTTTLQYESFSAFEAHLTGMVDYIIQDGTSETTEGNWMIGFEQLEKETGFCIGDKPFLQELIADMLSERQEVSDVQIGNDCFDVCYYLSFCVNCQEESESEEKWVDGQNQNRLSDMLETRWENVHLMHADIDTVPHTIVELDSHTLTEAGKEAWADVMEANVSRVYQGYYGLQMELTGVRASRINEFSAMLGGYCSVENYEKWVNDDDNQQDELAMFEK